MYDAWRWKGSRSLTVFPNQKTLKLSCVGKPQSQSACSGTSEAFFQLFGLQQDRFPTCQGEWKKYIIQWRKM